MNQLLSYRIFPLGDSALTIDFGNVIDVTINKEVFNRFNELKNNPVPGTIEILPAYSALTVYYNIMELKKTVPAGITVADWMKGQLEKRLGEPAKDYPGEQQHIRIPVCYENEFAPDMWFVMNEKNITADELIEIHTSVSYRVYMLGFLPGFAYMGEVDERIVMPRKMQPQSVPTGSIGIAGKQTGIYPLASPGGWQIIGKTPLRLFDAKKEKPALLNAGDTVQFYPISKNEFANY